MLTPEQWQYLESLPRRTLQNRVDYWAIRHELEDEDRQASRIRPYIFRPQKKKQEWFE